MSTIIRLILAVAALIALVPVACGQMGLHPTSIEIAQLPRFCLSQVQVPDAKGAEFSIVGCGPGANHYCSALLAMIRAKGRVNKSTRSDLLGGADANVRYTEKAIADYPKCPIREHVVATRAELNSLLTIYSYKRPKAKRSSH
jgi:hypothetical protein